MAKTRMSRLAEKKDTTLSEEIRKEIREFAEDYRIATDWILLNEIKTLQKNAIDDKYEILIGEAIELYMTEKELAIN